VPLQQEPKQGELHLCQSCQLQQVRLHQGMQLRCLLQQDRWWDSLLEICTAGALLPASYKLACGNTITSSCT
jgi:hypothetical protein